MTTRTLTPETVAEFCGRHLSRETLFGHAESSLALARISAEEIVGGERDVARWVLGACRLARAGGCA